MMITINILLSIGFFLIGYNLHRVALKRPDPGFGRIDFLFSYLMYLISLIKFSELLNATNIIYILRGFEVIILYYMLFVLLKLIPEAMKIPTRKELVATVITQTKIRTREEIYNEIMNERVN